MKLIKRILSTLLAVTMILAALVAVFTVPVAAAEEQEGSPLDVEDYLTTEFKTPEDKLASLKFMYRDDTGRYELYADTVTGEVACLDTASGDILFTNPYDVASHSASDGIKEQILSQVLITYKRTSATDPSVLFSYTDAAKNGQIKVQKIKKGIRVEYTLGREDTNLLLPKLIMADDFENNILLPMREAIERGEFAQMDYDRLLNQWQLIDLNNDYSNPAIRFDLAKNTYPFLQDMATEVDGTVVYPAFYKFNDKTPTYRARQLEDQIKKYTAYSYEQLELDHARTKYESDAQIEPAFKLALEYYADENGMTVRLPSNGIRYDMTNFTLEDVTILPFIGAGQYTQGGYAFFPDGSGAIFDYETMNSTSVTPTGKVYGEDYGYSKLEGMKYEKIIRYPVLGSVSTERIYSFEDKRVSATVQSLDSFKAELEAAGAVNPVVTTTEYERGVFMILEAADSLSHLEIGGGLTEHRYCILQSSFNPKPKDTYHLDATGGSITVVSDRKYTGSLTLRFVMLTDASRMKGDATYYGTDWMDMAEAYRDYLSNNGVLEPIKDSEVQKDIPLYIESFGAVETQQTIATVPVYLMTPITTFDDVWTMYDTFSKANVKNINFKLTGFANGGMFYEVPSALKWEDVVGGKDGFKALVNKANEVNGKNDGSHLGLYPDFDFAYIQQDYLFDAVNLNDDAIKGVDNRYTDYRQYSPTEQTFFSFYQLALSPSRYSKFYTELLKNYEEYGVKTISIASLGTALNTDFDEEDPYNREDAKNFTASAFADIKEKGYDIMTDGGNAYTWKYADHILNVELDSSRRLEASASVPFIGTVLHGSIQFTGAPLNEEGDTNYALLRAIENGAGMYFLLSYQNTTEFKDFTTLSQYYSIRYDIWQEDVVKYYNQLNLALGDVQTKYIINHEFLSGERILDLDELEAAIADKLAQADKDQEESFNQYLNGEMNSVADAWGLLYGAKDAMVAILDKMETHNESVADLMTVPTDQLAAAVTALNDADTAKALAKAAEDAALADLDAAKEASTAEEGTEDPAVTAAQQAYDNAKQAHTDAQKVYDDALAALIAAINDAYKAVIALIDHKIALDQLKAEADALNLAIPQAITIVENTTVYDEGDPTHATLLAQMNAYKDELVNGAYYAAVHTAYSTYKAELDIKAETSVFQSAALENAKIFGDGEDAYVITDIEKIKKDCAAAVFTMESLTERYDALTLVIEEEDTSTSDKEENSYLVDNNKIVAVTYGKGDDAYKTFILNYNSYSVRVSYNGEIYTIGSGEYVVVTYSDSNS